MTPIHLTLVGKPGCHLCDDARAVLREVMQEFDGTELSELSILDDPALFERYAEEIPVVLINDVVHNIWRINPDRLRTALRDAAS